MFPCIVVFIFIYLLSMTLHIKQIQFIYSTSRCCIFNFYTFKIKNITICYKITKTVHLKHALYQNQMILNNFNKIFLLEKKIFCFFLITCKIKLITTSYKVTKPLQTIMLILYITQ